MGAKPEYEKREREKERNRKIHKRENEKENEQIYTTQWESTLDYMNVKVID